jgi:hypothetical protein
MFYFCFNDCIPKESNKYLLVGSLTSTLGEFRKIKNNYPEEVTGIITEKTPSNIMLDDQDFSLFDCMSYLDKSLKTYAHSLFYKYPIEDYLAVKDEESLINNNYSISVNNIIYDAINLAIFFDNDGVLFTLSLHEHLKKDKIKIYCNNELWNSIFNLYGEVKNTSTINEIVEDDRKNSLENFEKLLVMVGENVYSGRFKKGFEKITQQVQGSILKHIQEAIDRKGNTKFFPDGDLIKDITPEKELEIKLYELRVFKPVAYRVYFYETPSKIFLGLIDKKPANNVQSNQIKNAISIIKELLKTHN